MDIKTVVTRALQSAQSNDDHIPNEGDRNQARSARFVGCLANELLLAHGECAGKIAVMSKNEGRNRPLFGMNELLFDVTVVQYAIVNPNFAKIPHAACCSASMIRS